MSLLLGALIASAIASGGVGILSSIFNKNAQDEANRTNIKLQDEANALQVEEAEKNRQFQAEQADINRAREDNAIQRQMADMQAAGLNPLAAGGYGGASSSAGVGSTSPANINSAKVAPSSLDLSSIANLFSSMSNAMLTSKLIGENPLGTAKSNFLNAKANDIVASQASKIGLNNAKTNYFSQLKDKEVEKWWFLHRRNNKLL